MSRQPLRLPAMSARPLGLLRSGLRWLHQSGDQVKAREALAVCHLRLSGSRIRQPDLPLAEEQHDLQAVLASRSAGTLELQADLSRGGYQDLLGSTDWDEGTSIGSIDGAAGGAGIEAMVLAGRRGFENGEGRGGLLAGWHDRVRAFWQGDSDSEFGTVLSLGTCEHTGVFRGEDMAFLSWFARAPGPAQIISVADERCVHSSAVLLQHLRRTPAEAMAITEAVQRWLSERMAQLSPESFPALQASAAQGRLGGRWPQTQDLLFALLLLEEAVGTCPMLERTEVLTRQGAVRLNPPDAIALSLGSELAPHFRHRRTGWMIAIHGFRFGPYIGSGIADWLRREFEPVRRSVADMQRDLAALAEEIGTRTGAVLLVQNLVASSAINRVANYAWLGDSFGDSSAVVNTEANLMLSALTQAANISVIDSDALAADLGVDLVPDGSHAARELLQAQRQEYHHVLRERQIPGF
jgi:hypothetical protein